MVSATCGEITIFDKEVFLHMTRRLFSLLNIIILASSCSTYSIVNSHVKGKLKRAGFIHHVIQTKDFQIDYWDNEVDKPVVVLVHGFGATASFQWLRQLNALKRDFRVIVPNLLYFGESRPMDSTNLKLQSQIKHIRALLNTLKIDKFILCGVSYGGLVSGEIARQSPERIEKLILFDAPIKFYGKADIQFVCEKYEVDKIEDFFVPSDYRGMKKLVKAGFHRPPPVPSIFLKSFYKEQYESNADELRQLLVDLQNDEAKYVNMNYDFSFPVLLLWGEEDDIVQSRRAQQLHEYLTDSKLQVISRSKHFPNLERHRKFNHHLMQFIHEGSE
jgi:pimeloyl-ACP methyl ester carboxylesterase